MQQASLWSSHRFALARHPSLSVCLIISDLVMTIKLDVHFIPDAEQLHFLSAMSTHELYLFSLLES